MILGSNQTKDHIVDKVILVSVTSKIGSHGGIVATHSSPTSDFIGSNLRPCVGKLVVSHRQSAVYSTEP